MQHDRHVAGPLVDQCREAIDLASIFKLHMPCAGHRGRLRQTCRGDERLDLVNADGHFERRFFTRLRTASLANAQAPFDRQHRVGAEQVVHLGIEFGKDDHFATAGRILDLRDQNLLAGLGHRATHAGDQPGNHDGRVVGYRADVFDRHRAHPRQPRHNVGQRMPRKKDSERFAFPRQLLAVGRWRHRRQARRQRRRGSAAIAKQRCLAELIVARRTGGDVERGVQCREFLRAIPGKRVERAAFDERFEDAPIGLFGIDALGEIEQVERNARRVRAPR